MKSLAVAAAIAGVLLLAGCASDAELQQLDASHVGDGVTQHSLEMMAERIPALAVADSVTYYGGYFGSVDPSRTDGLGPTDLWIHALVDLAPGGAEALLDSVDDAYLAGVVPEVVPPLAGEVPPGELRMSPSLDARFSANGWWSTVFVSPASNQLVLITVTM